MKVTLLGTGTSHGIPMIGCHCDVCASKDPRDKRLRSSIFIETTETNILIDTTPDFRQQALKANIKRIDAILYTHAHKDHLAGLDDIKPFNYILKKAIPIYAEQNVINTIENEFDYAFKIPDNSVPKLILNPITPDKTFEIGTIKIIPIRMMHGNLPVLGFRIGDFAYLTDFKTIEQNELQKVMGVKTLIIEALRLKPHPSHQSFKEALEIIKVINPQSAILTHISHKLGKHCEIKEFSPPQIRAGYDNEMLNIPES
ncbi:MAG: MBL fold metallo-hydrolase [Salinivirgaceae bacterium]|nr:MBL fold metallo-hydrolase [Salinivirgaceae bacterium]